MTQRSLMGLFFVLALAGCIESNTGGTQQPPQDPCGDEPDDGCCTPEPETCDGVDNDCDGLVDLDDPDGCGVTAGCKLPFPPPATVPCDVPETGLVFYVDASAGSDANPGNAPGAPWATLQHAIDAAPVGSTIRVAPGAYGAAPLTVAKDLVIKGGYDPTFTTWDPDANHSSYTGPLTIERDAAVWAGFRMIANVPPGGPTPWTVTYHTVSAGSLVRNVIGILFTGDMESTFFTGIDARPTHGHTTRIACNDIYQTTKGPMLWSDSVLDYSGLSSTSHVESNRICFDDADPGNPHPTYILSGYGACVDEAEAHAFISNNIFENPHDNIWSSGISFYGCGDAIESQNTLDIAVTNNSIVTGSAAIEGYSGDGDGAVLTWRIVNNIVATPSGGGDKGIAVNYDVDPFTVLAESHGNLVFGFNTNAVFPPPVSSTGDDVSGVHSLATVFVDANQGDFRPLPGGPADGTGMNVFGNAVYGGVTTDLSQAARPQNGPWVRGALLP
jgi:hypothetical protein